MKSKIVIIIPYFGKFPEWMDLYLYSCSKNDYIDFVFFSDCPPPLTKYKNTIFKYISFADYCKMVSFRLKIPFSPSNPYKLCDLRPFYGYIHDDLTSNYEYWGFGDIDVVYGNLRLYLNPNKFKYFDFFSAHGDRVSGHLTIIKKGSKFDNKCFKIKDWKNKLTNPNHLGIDESDFTSICYPQLRYLMAFHRYFLKPFKIVCNSPYYLGVLNKIFCNRLTRQSFKEYYTTVPPNESDIWIYDPCNGSVKFKERCLPYLHFMYFKKTPYLETPYFWRKGFYKINENTLFFKYKIAIDRNAIYQL